MNEIRWFAVQYCEVGFLHQNKVYIFGFSTSVASFPYIDCIGANAVPRWKVAPSFENLHWRPYTRCMKLGGLQSRTAKWAFCTKTRFTFWVLHLRSFLSIYRLHWCKHGTTVKGSPEFRKFTLTALYAVHEIRWFAVPYCEVGFLHQNKVYIFGFSTSVASFPYIDCIGANTVPRCKIAPSFANLHWRS